MKITKTFFKTEIEFEVEEVIRLSSTFEGVNSVTEAMNGIFEFIKRITIKK